MPTIGAISASWRMSCRLRVIRRLLSTPRQNTVLPNIVERHAADVLHHVLLSDPVEAASLQPDTGDIGLLEAPKIQRILCFSARHIPNIDVSYHRTFRTIGAFFVEQVDLQDGIGHLANADIPEVDVLNNATPHGVTFESQR